MSIRALKTRIIIFALFVLGLCSIGIGVSIKTVSAEIALENFSMKDGMSIRMQTPIGIRFVTEISTEDKKKLPDDAVFGTLILPVTMWDGTELKLETEKVLNIECKVWNKQDENGLYQYNTVLVGENGNDFLSNAYNVNFIGRSYVKFTEEGVEKVLYTNSISRSIAYVAVSALNDGETSELLTNIVSTALKEQSIVLTVEGGTANKEAYIKDESATLTANVEAGETFLYWEKDGEWYSNSQVITVKAEENATYKAYSKNLSTIDWQYEGYGTEKADVVKFYRDEKAAYVKYNSTNDYVFKNNRTYVLLDSRADGITRGDTTPITDETYMCFGYNNSNSLGYAAGFNVNKTTGEYTSDVNTTLEDLSETGKYFTHFFDADYKGGLFVIPYASFNLLTKGENNVDGNSSFSVNLRTNNNSPWATYDGKMGGKDSLASEKNNINTWATWSPTGVAMKTGATIVLQNATIKGKFCNLDDTFNATAKGAAGETFLYWTKNGDWFSNSSTISITADADATYAAAFKNLSSLTYHYDGYGMLNAEELKMTRDESNFYIRFKATNGNSFNSNRYYVLFDVRTNISATTNTKVTADTYICFGFNSSTALGYATGLNASNATNTSLSSDTNKHFNVIFDSPDADNKIKGGVMVIPYRSVSKLIVGDYTITQDTSVSVCTTVMGTLIKENGSTGWTSFNWKYNNSTQIDRLYVNTWAIWTKDGIALNTND